MYARKFVRVPDAFREQAVRYGFIQDAKARALRRRSWLYLQVAVGGSKSWLFRFRRERRARKMGLGPIHTVSFAMARDEALECRRKLLEGIDPIDQRQEAEEERRLAKLKGVTFRQAAERYIAAN